MIRLYGQAPGRLGETYRAFRGGTAGARLARLAGVSEEEFHEFVECRNLFDRWPGKNGRGDRFPLDEARARAEMERWFWEDGDVAIFAGRSVAEAFEYGDLPWCFWEETEEGWRVALIPHPSGMNRMWNYPHWEFAASRILRQALARSEEPPKGLSQTWRSDRAQGSFADCGTNETERSLTNRPDERGENRSVSVASTPRGGASCDDEAMR